MEILNLLKIVLIGVVEGITEWLPISSTGHMLLLDEWMPLQMSAEYKEMFFVVIQLGAILAVVLKFWDKVFPFQLKDHFGLKKDVISMWLKVVLASVPTGILFLFLDDYLEAHFGTPITIALMLVLYGIFFILVENWNKKRVPKINEIGEIGYQTALMFGLFQSLAMIPGTSRSGATIIGGLLLGVSRRLATEFSFFLAIPAMLGASAVKLFKFGLDFSTNELVGMILGMVVAFVVSLIAIQFLMEYLKKHDFKMFGWYRIVLGILVLLLVGIW